MLDLFLFIVLVVFVRLPIRTGIMRVLFLGVSAVF
jgi:hypothetical protein